MRSSSGVGYLPCQYHRMQYLKLWRRNNSEIEKLNFTRVIKTRLGMRFELHPKTLPQHLHIALTAVATVHIGNRVPLWRDKPPASWVSEYCLLTFDRAVDEGSAAIRPLPTTGQHKHRKSADIQPCSEWDSNLWSGCVSGRRQYTLHIARPLPSTDWQTYGVTSLRVLY
jgi:hypothetical protein